MAVEALVGPDAKLRTGSSVLIVDGNDSDRESIGSHLTGEGFEISSAPDGPPALDSVRLRTPNVVLLELVLPTMSGLEVLNLLRTIRPGLPTILMSSARCDRECFAGLEIGADDCMLKPVLRAEAVARVKTVLRRAHYRRCPTGVSRCNDLEIDVPARSVRRGGEVVHLTAKEFELLSFLASHPRQVFSREQLLTSVWQSSIQWQSPDTVTEHVRRIRRKIEADRNAPKFLVTVRGGGYRFTPEPESA